MLRRRGAETLAVPLIEIIPPADWSEVDAAVARLDEYAYVILTSVNAVEMLHARLRGAGVGAAACAAAEWVCVGPKTAAALTWLEREPLLPPGGYRAEMVAEMLLERGVAGKKIFYPRARLARDVLPARLRAGGALLDDPVIYDTVPARAGGGRLRAVLAAKEVDAITFASSSSVENFVALLGADCAALCADVVLASIGPVTSTTARRLGLRVDVEAGSYTLAGLTAALEEYFAPEAVGG